MFEVHGMLSKKIFNLPYVGSKMGNSNSLYILGVSLTVLAKNSKMGLFMLVVSVLKGSVSLA